MLNAELLLQPTPASRREAIRHIIRAARVDTQEELRRRLRKEGFVVTQATLSRDLARIGARRGASPEGGTAYALSDDLTPVTGPLMELKGMVLSIRHNGSLVVLRTQAGAASAVALAIDKAMIPEFLGTLAGDDTIFLAPAEKTSTARAAEKLVQLLGRGGGR